ncbi:MAG: hypothetical protein QOE69_1983 [Thermoleophilaceae bacterium]|nr:hypothetical protein [Thermoleophilaceae bacterium]
MELVTSRLPAEFDVTADHDAWPFFGYALLSRTTGTLDSVFRLQPTERGSDAMTLVRSLYEHIVHFAWLSADPSAERIGQWRKHDLTERLKADNDTQSVGVELFTPAQRQNFEAQRDALPGANSLVLANLAGEADDYWNGKVEGLQSRHQPRSFRGLYATAYRFQSGLAHPGERSLHPVVQDVTARRKLVKVEDSFEGNGPYGMATTVYALGLLVAEQSLGWPTNAEVNAVFQRGRGLIQS